MKITRSFCTGLLTAAAFMVMPLPASTEEIIPEETVSTGPFTSVILLNHGTDEAVEIQTLLHKKRGADVMPSRGTYTLTFTITNDGGTTLGEVSQDVPNNGVATMRFETDDMMSSEFVTYNANGNPIGQIKITGGRVIAFASIKMRAKTSDSSVIDPATGELRTIPASVVPFTKETIINKNTGGTQAATGTVKWFNESKGFGFIAPTDGDQ